MATRPVHLAPQVAGLAVLTNCYPLDAEERDRYFAMGSIFQRARHTREYYRRTLKRVQDLQVGGSGAVARDKKEVLPKDLGLDSQGNGQPWGIGELMSRGDFAARAAGCTEPTNEQKIRCGLTEAARLNPLFIRL